MSSLSASFLNISLLLSVALSTGCASEIGQPKEGTADASPIKFNETKDPPSQTAPKCDGVDVRGECQDGNRRRVYCDVDNNSIKNVDCEATGSECFMDEQRGFATCTVPEDTSGLNECLTMGTAGSCSADKKDLSWCSGTEDSEIVTEACEAGEECQVDGCAVGSGTPFSACCPVATDQPDDELCPDLGPDGMCEDNKLKYCEGSTLVEVDCPESGMNCSLFPSGQSRCFDGR